MSSESSNGIETLLSIHTCRQPCSFLMKVSLELAGMCGKICLSLAVKKVQVLQWLCELSLSVEKVVWHMLDLLCVGKLGVDVGVICIRSLCLAHHVLLMLIVGSYKMC